MRGDAWMNVPMNVRVAEARWPRQADSAQHEHEVECPYCGLLQLVPVRERTQIVSCRRCHSRLEHCAGTHPDLALACSLGALLLLIPAWTLPFLTTSALGATRTSHLYSSATVLWREGQHLLAVVVALVILVFPVVRLTALAAVLLALRVGARPPWLAAAFRLGNALQTWSMLDVFLLGFMVAYFRMRASIPATIEAGAVFFMATIVLGVTARAGLDKAGIWHSIGRERRCTEPQAAIACLSCGLLVGRSCEGQGCPRCGASVRARKPDSYSRALALLCAAMLLYLPANLYPIATIPIGLTPTSYTVLGGVVDLAESQLFGLALLVFTASFTIPLLKMAGLAWCIISAWRRHSNLLVAKTRVYRIVEEMGRWSMVDPLTIACFVPVLQFNGLIDGRAQPAATPFTAVVILTTLALRAFDPRLMWDAAGTGDGRICAAR
jgi:paraquat-inducible protein A